MGSAPIGEPSRGGPRRATELADLVASVALGTVCAVSLGFVTTANRFGRIIAPRLAWLPDSCALSLLACVLVYLAIRPKRPFAGPARDTRWPWIQRLSAYWLGLWLLASAVSAMLAGHWVRYRLAEGPAPLAGFLLLGPLQEELLFRGAVFELAERSRIAPGVRFPIAVSTLFFALHHFQLHGYALTPTALLQVGFALPMGLVLGVLRAESGSLWPAFVVHVLTNLPGALGR